MASDLAPPRPSGSRLHSSKSPFASTANSSTTTLHEPTRPAAAAPHTLTPALEAEIARDEARFEKYGGDDPEEPTPKPLAGTPAIPANLSKDSDYDPDLVTWDGPDDPENPQNWTRRKKWIVTWTAVILSINVTFASSAPSSAMPLIAKTFGVSQEVSYLTTSVFLIGYVFGPLVWGPGSELIGRRPIFLLTIVLYTLFHLGQALAQNIETLLITRFFGGFFACAPLTNSGGLIADIWDPAGRGTATSLFTAAVFLGPVLGPIVSAFIVESSLGWRWVFWVMMIFAGVCAAISFITLPETFAPVLLAQKAKRLRKQPSTSEKPSSRFYAEHERQDWSFSGVLHRSLFRPFAMLLAEPILVLVTLYMAVIYGLLYALFQAFPIIFIVRRGFTVWQDGLMFIGVGIGTTLGSIIFWWMSRDYPALIKEWRGFPPAEIRLKGAMLASPMLVIGCFWLGWTGEYASVPWYVPAIGTVILGTSISLVFMSFLSYLVDTYLMYSASAFAANTFIRSAVAAGFPLFTVQMFTKLGVNWACTLLGLVGVMLAPSPFLFYKYGPRIRMRSKFAPCLDLKIRAEIEEEQRVAREGKPAAGPTAV